MTAEQLAFENLLWREQGYELLLTEDQSPSLRWLASPTQESMHHRGGAYSETQLIYGNPLRDVISQGGRSAVSVGLGLGYNEILVAVEALKDQIAPKDFRILSFESEQCLRDQFLTWCEAQESSQVYDFIFEFFGRDASGISKAQVREWLTEAFRLETWTLLEKLTPEMLPKLKSLKNYECIFYDAFSAKTSPYLWEEVFLTEFFASVSAPSAQVSTYACTGALKRALRTAGFQVILRSGFQNRKNSTLGRRPAFFYED